MTEQEPLTPRDCDLRDFQFMPLDVVRLRDSDLIAQESPEAAIAAILLWCAAWHQMPAASLPADDVSLARLAGYGKVVAAWRKVRDGALRNWIACADGRLYHPVVAEKARESWQSKLEHAHRRMCDRVRKENKQREAAKLPPLEAPTFDAWNSSGRADPIPPESRRNSAGNPAENALKGQGTEGTGRSKGQGQGKELQPQRPEVPPAPPTEPVATAAAKKPRRAARQEGDEGRTVPTWRAYSEAYHDRYGVEPTSNAKTFGMLARFLERVPVDDAPAVAAHFVRSNSRFYVLKRHPVSLLLADAEALRTAWLTGAHGTETQARQADRTAATFDTFGKLIEETRQRNGTEG